MAKESSVKNPDPSPGETVSLSMVIKAAKAMRLEPICALHMTSAVMVSMIAVNLMMERACKVNIGASQQECDNFFTGNFTEDNMDFYIDLGTEIQHQVSSNNVWRNAIEYSLPIFYMLLMGNWSDKHGRKPILLLPVIGYMITTGGLLLSLYYEEWSLEVIALWTSLPLALTGSSSLFGMAAYSWVGDTSTSQLRTLRIGLLSCGWFLGTALGMTFGGHLYEPLGFKGIFILGESLELAAFLGIVFFIKNTRLSTSVSPAAAELDLVSESPSEKVFFKETKSPSEFEFESESSTEKRRGNIIVSTSTVSSPSPSSPSSSHSQSSSDDSVSKEIMALPALAAAASKKEDEDELLPSHIIVTGTKGKSREGRRGAVERKMKVGMKKEEEEEEGKKEETNRSEKKKRSSRVSDLFDYSNVTEAFRTAFKSREGNKRLHIWILFIVLFLGLAPTSGETNVLYLFVVYKLGWRAEEYGNFGTYMLFIATLGTFVSMGVLSYFLKLPDPLIGIVSCCSQMAAAFVYGFASKSRSWMMYLAPLIDSINGTVTIVTRSMGSKLVHPDELGRLNAFFGIADAIVPLIANTLYNTLYNMTLTSFPGAFFLVSAAITVPVLLIFAWFYWQVRKEQNEELKTDGIAEEGGDSTDSEASGSHTPEKERF